MSDYDEPTATESNHEAPKLVEDDQQEIANVSDEEEQKSEKASLEGEKGLKVQEEEGHMDEDGDAKEDDENEVMEYVVQHGAHKEFWLRKKFMLHEAKKPMNVTGGEQVGKMLASRSYKQWEGLKWYHVHIVGGTTRTTGKKEYGPYVCFNPPDGSPETDDVNWLRPIPSMVMNHFQQIWPGELKSKYPEDRKPGTAKRLLENYSMVLNWRESMLSGPKLDVATLGVGEFGMVPLTRKLKSIRLNVQKPSVQNSSKLVSAIGKGKSAKKQSTEDYGSECGQVSAVDGARTIRLGEVATTNSFEIDGVLYATFLP